MLKKLNFKAIEFTKKPIFIVNNSESINIDILSDLLNNLSSMKNIDDIYENNLHIFTFIENKKTFKEILLDNPHMHFINFVIKNKLKSIKSDSNKKNIVIIDFNLISDNLNQLLETNLLDSNIQLIILFSNYSTSINDIYKMTGKNTLIINKKDTLKLRNKRFYSKVISQMTDINQSNYFELINDDRINNIIIKNRELRFN
jgi:hypothetical protein